MKSKTSVERLIAYLGLQTEEGNQLWGVSEVSALIHGCGVLTHFAGAGIWDGELSVL